MQSAERTGLVLGLVGVVCFGLTLPATRIALTGLDPWLIGLGRGVVAGIAAAVILAAMRAGWPPRDAWRGLCIAAGGVVLGFPLFATLAMQYAPAAHGAVVLAILPLMTAVGGALLAGERPSLGFWVCSVAGTLAVLVFALLEGAGNEGFHAADLLLAAAVIAAAVGYAEGGRLARTMGGWQVICWVLVISAPVLAAFLLLWGTPINWTASLYAWGGFLYLALVSQLLAFFAWYQGMALGGVAKVGQLQLLQTFVTLVAAWALLGERITWLQIAFACLVVAIVAIGRNMQVTRPKS
ncbi:MAG: DMT family transporter [Hyphomicrobiaceae bacterium]|nr:DMT family transporter [Hyphomicrobiaceae bacterium]